MSELLVCCKIFVNAKQLSHFYTHIDIVLTCMRYIIHSVPLSKVGKDYVAINIDLVYDFQFCMDY